MGCDVGDKQEIVEMRQQDVVQLEHLARLEMPSQRKEHQHKIKIRVHSIE